MEKEKRETSQTESVVSVSDWFVTVLIASIPIIGLIMLFVWAFGGGSNENKENWAKANLLWYAVALAIFLLFLLLALLFAVR